MPVDNLPSSVSHTRRPGLKMTVLAVSLIAVIIGALALTPLVINWTTAGTAEQFRANAAQPLTEEEKQELVLAAKAAPAADFIASMESYAPAGYSITTVKNGTADSLVSWVCSNLSITPSPVLGTQIELSSATTVTISAFGAGQSTQARDSYRKGIRNCTGRNGSAGIIESKPMAVGDYPGFSFSSGGVNTNVWVQSDVMITVSARDNGTIRDLSREYRDKVAAELTATTCLSHPVTTEDATRSPYYNAEAYTGWNRGREVSLNPQEPGIVAGAYGPGAAFKGTGKRLGAYSHQEGPAALRELPDTPSVPESPLPAGVPASLPAEVPTPTTKIAEVRERPETTTVIPERVEDLEGPGCGWAWTGQKAPMFDATEEKKRADEAAGEEIKRMRTEHGEYLASIVDNHNTTLQYNREADAYNAYVESFEEVTETWDDINDKRAEYRVLLDEYWEDVEAHENFATERAEAQTAYDKDVQYCLDNPTIVEERPVYPTPVTPEPAPQPSDGGGAEPTPTPAPAPIMEKVEVPNPECPADRPAILDQRMPERPAPPAKPDVPLPASWTDVP